MFRVRGFPLEMLAYTESTNPNEMLHLLKYLIGQGWIELKRESLGTKAVTLTVEGSEHLAGMENVNRTSSQAFVAMWFDESVNAAWEEAIKPAIEDTGYKAVRIDEVGHLNKIDEQIMSEIRASRFVVADFTHGEDGARGGVYYEAGFAHGLDIPVIFTCRKDKIEHVHFDTRQYPHLLWQRPEELRELLTVRILEAIGVGPLNKEELEELK